MQRPSVCPKHHVRRKTARPRPGARGQRTPEPPPAIRPSVLAGVALALCVGFGTIWLVEAADAPADAALVEAKAPERRVVKLSKPAGARSAPAREHSLEPGPVAEDPERVFPGGDAELAALAEDPAAEAREASPPPNPVDLEIRWRNEGEEFADVSDDGVEFDPEASADEPDEHEPLGEVEFVDSDAEEDLFVPHLAEFEEEEAFLYENDEDFRGRDDLAEFEHVVDDEPELESATAS